MSAALNGRPRLSLGAGGRSKGAVKPCGDGGMEALRRHGLSIGVADGKSMIAAQSSSGAMEPGRLGIRRHRGMWVSWPENQYGTDRQRAAPVLGSSARAALPAGQTGSQSRCLTRVQDPSIALFDGELCRQFLAADF